MTEFSDTPIALDARGGTSPRRGDLFQKRVVLMQEWADFCVVSDRGGNLQPPDPRRFKGVDLSGCRMFEDIILLRVVQSHQ